jgi:hypothetical protein
MSYGKIALRATCVAACVAALTACSNKTPKKDLAVHTDSSGVEIITNTGTYKPLKWAFDTAFTIGASGDSAFQRVREHTVAVSKDGHIYILDTTTRRIDIHDASGRLVASIPPGAGGHLASPSALLLQPDGIAVYDAERSTLVRFSPEGKYLGQTGAPRQYQEGVMRSDSDAIILAQKVHDPKTNEPVMSIVRISATDTASIIAAQIDEEMNVQFPGCGIQMSLAPIFGEPPAWNAGYGITAVAEAPLHGVRLYRGTKEFRRIRRKVRPEGATNQYALLAAGDDREIPLPNGTTCTITPLEIAKGSGWKEVIPAIGAIAIKPDGGLWLRRVDPGRAEPAVDVIDPKGEYLGTLPLHTPWPLGFLPNGNPVALREDSLGVNRIVIYRINTNPPPATPPKKDAKK